MAMKNMKNMMEDRKEKHDKMPSGMEKHEGPVGKGMPMHDPAKDPMIQKCLKDCRMMKDES